MALSYDSIPGWTCSEIEALYDEASLGRWGPLPWTVVEVGVAFGRSLAYLAQRTSILMRIVGVDVWKEHMGGDNLPPDVFARQVAHGTPRQACEANLRACGVLDRVELLGCGSIEAAKMFEDESIDLVFIDACHEMAQVRADIDAWWPKVRVGGKLAGHDYSIDQFPGVVSAVLGAFQFGERARPIETRGVVWRVRK